MPGPSLGLEELAPDSRCSTLVMSKAETNGFGVPDFQNKSTYVYIYIYIEREREREKDLDIVAQVYLQVTYGCCKCN